VRKGWEVKKIGEICDIKSGTTLAKNLEKSLGEVPYLKVADMNMLENVDQITTSSRFINETDVKNAQVIPRGSTIFPKRGGAIFTNKKRFVDIPVLLDLNIMAVTPRTGLLPMYLYYYFINIDLREIDNGSSIPQINNYSIEPLIIAYPRSLNEQKQIVSILDEAFEGIAKAKANAEKNLANARGIFESYLQSVFNESSDGWVEQKLGDVCSLITDGKHGDCNNKNDSGYYFLSAKDVKNNTLQYEKARQITKNDFEETHRRTDLKPGDVLITNSGTIGRMAIAPNDSKTYKTTFQKSVAVLKPKPAIINNVFCCYHLRADLSKLVNVSAGTAQKNLLIGDLKNHLIKIPPISKQLELIEKLDNLSLETSKLESLYERKMVDLEELKKSILQKAFSGDLIRRAS
jgi:type I restriction enzyme S subunit